MKKLREFNRFDCESFFKDKDVRVIAHEDWNEYEENQATKKIGTKYKCIIVTDKTVYKGKDVPNDLNAGEQIYVKVAHDAKDYQKFSRIKFINASASVYGSFMSELSVKADDVEITSIKQ